MGPDLALRLIYIIQEQINVLIPLINMLKLTF